MYISLNSHNPCVFILEPGQFVHLNKGRLHAFRKMTNSQLPTSDCHHNLRKKIINFKPTVCISIAWDWMYLGVTDDGICAEMKNLMDAVQSARNNKIQVLAIQKCSLMKLAEYHLQVLQCCKGTVNGTTNSVDAQALGKT